MDEEFERLLAEAGRCALTLREANAAYARAFGDLWQRRPELPMDAVIDLINSEMREQERAAHLEALTPTPRLPEEATIREAWEEDNACSWCGGFADLVAVMSGHPCPECGQGTPGGRMVLTDDPYVAGRVLDEARTAQGGDDAG